MPFSWATRFAMGVAGTFSPEDGKGGCEDMPEELVEGGVADGEEALLEAEGVADGLASEEAICGWKFLKASTWALS